MVAAAEEERFSRRKHGKRPVPFSAWELPELAAALVPGRRPGCAPDDAGRGRLLLRPGAAPAAGGARRSTTRGTTCASTYAERAPELPRRRPCPGLDPAQVRFVPHHVAHAASAGAGRAVRRRLRGAGAGRARRAAQPPGRPSTATAGCEIAGTASSCRTRSACSTRTLTEHLGFLRSQRRVQGDGAGLLRHSRGSSTQLRELVHADRRRRVPRRPARLDRAAPRPRAADERAGPHEHADLAASVQARARGGAARPGPVAARRGPATGTLTMAGGVALNCVANTRISAEGAVRRRSGCSRRPATPGTALGGALHVAARLGEPTAPMPGADLGRGWTDERDRGRAAHGAGLPYERPRRRRRGGRRGAGRRRHRRLVPGPQRVRPARARATARCWPTPGGADNLDAAQRRQGPRAVPAGRADGAAPSGPPRSSPGPIPSPVHAVRARRRRGWRDRIPAVVHVDGTARVQTVDPATEPLVARMLAGLRAAHRPAGGGQHQPEHRRPADGRHAARRAGVLRFRAGRPAGDRPVRGAPRRRACRDRRPEPDGDVASASSSRRSAGRRLRHAAGARGRVGGTAGRRRVVVVDDRPAPGRPLACRMPAGWPAGDGAAGRRPRPGGGAQRRLAGHRHRVGGVPRRRRAVPPGLARRPAARPGRPPAATWPASGTDRRAAAGRTVARPTGSAAPPGWPTARWITADMAYRRARPGARSAASTSGSPGPSARTPTWRCGCAPPATACARAAPDAPCIRSGRRAGGPASRSSAATPTTC